MVAIVTIMQSETGITREITLSAPYLRHIDESSECATVRQHNVAEVACYRLERTLPSSKGVGAPHQCSRVNKNQSGWGEFVTYFNSFCFSAASRASISCSHHPHCSAVVLSRQCAGGRKGGRRDSEDGRGWTYTCKRQASPPKKNKKTPKNSDHIQRQQNACW